MIEPAPTKGPEGALRRTIARFVTVLLLVLILHQLLSWASHEAAQAAGGLRFWTLSLFLLVYALLIAVPFVPGVEVGLTLMAMEGPWIAPWIYLSTVAGLTCAYVCGGGLSYKRLYQILADLRMQRACRLIERLQELDGRERLQLLEQRLPVWARPLVLRYRYCVMAALINLPGNSLIGGGGGLMLLVGFSRLFHIAPMTLTLLIAVAPVPLMFWAFGFDLNTLW